MSGHDVLLNLLGGVALLVWATRLVRTGVLRAFGERFRAYIGKATASPVLACLTGMTVATAVQSSAATALIVTSFAERGMIALAPALAVMLGADIGSTLVVQVMSFNVAGFVPVLLITGVFLYMATSSQRAQQLGRIVIGLALMILSLGMIVAASKTMRESDVLVFVFARLAGDPILAVVVGAACAWLAHSSVAMVLLIASLAAVGILTPVLSLALVLGANIGSALIPVGLALKSPPPARRILFGNLAFRAIGAIAVLLLIEPATRTLGALDSDPARFVANAHTAFNLALAIVFLPFTGVAARLLERFVRADEEDKRKSRVEHLDDALLDRPHLALGAAAREVMRVADQVELMLREVIVVLDSGDDERAKRVKALDNDVDMLQEEVKLYLTRLTRQPLDEESSRRAFDLILFTTNLEHIGDIVDKNLMQLAEKKRRLNLTFSPEGWSEIQAMHQRVVDQMRLAMTVFVTRDAKMARDLFAAKDRLRLAEREATESHLKRLRDGTIASIETSALHLDILRDLKRVNAHITSVAHPILEAAGELKSTRLAPAGDESAPVALSAAKPS
jgi:phosphate:Na+ symporter